MLIGNRPVRFIHIPKNAGSSIIKFRDRNKINVLIGLESKGGIGNHRPAYSFLYEESYKFCIVRNPYSRIVSYYKYALKKLNDGGDQSWNYSFEEMVKEKISHLPTTIPSPWIPQVWWIFEHTSPFMKSKSMFGTVEEMENLKFVNLNSSLVDKIFKIEHPTFNEEIQEFLNCQNEFIKENISPGADDEVYYTPELKEIVYERLKVDFDILGYKK